MKFIEEFRLLTCRRGMKWEFSGFRQMVLYRGLAAFLFFLVLSGSQLLAQGFFYPLEQLTRFLSPPPGSIDFDYFLCVGHTSSGASEPQSLLFDVPPLPPAGVFSDGDGSVWCLEYLREDSLAAGSPAPVSLQGQVWDVATGEVLPGVALEVYQKRPDGRIILAYTGRTYSGSFAIPLVRGVTHIVILSRTGYQPEAYYVAADAVDRQRSFFLKRRAVPADTAMAGSVDETGRTFHDKASLPPGKALFLPADTVLAAPLSAAFTGLESDTRDKGAGGVLYEKGKKGKGEKAPATEQFELAASTSMRQGPSHETEVLLRFREGNRVEVLEKTNKYWWKVRFKDRQGYVKSLLLVPIVR